jgi:uncharacterized heparinase superfamily protein
MKLGELPRLLRTVRPLRGAQVWWRARYLLEHRRPPAAEPQPPAGVSERGGEFPRVPLFHRPGATGEEAVAMLAAGDFAHLNRWQNLGRERPDWRLGAATAHRLWVTTLHYHYWVYDLAEAAAAADRTGELAASLLRHYLSDWIERCGLAAAGARELAWNAYAVATRLSWWIRAWRLLGPERFGASPEFARKFLLSGWRQAAYLHRHLEWDLRGNHLLRDAAGLAWAGRFFAGAEAEQWLRTATALAADQVDEQVLADGGQFERSPMYHLHVMEDVLSLALLLEDAAVKEKLAARWTAMAEYLAWVRHPDGGIPLLNDAALGAYAEPAAMLARGGGIGAGMDASSRRGGRYFAETGLVVWQGEPWTVFFDVGPLGPDFQPGHAHADTLTLECSFAGQRLIVDPGTHSYDADERRRYDRSTRAHNTVGVDGQDSSEVWHIFRVGRRARPLSVKVETAANRLAAAAGHDGYDHLPGRPRPCRELSVANQGSLTVTDRIEGKGRHRLEGGFLLAPEWKATAIAGGFDLTSGSRRVRVRVAGPPELRLKEERRPYHPEYGLELETTRLSWSVDRELPVEVETGFEGG